MYLGEIIARVDGRRAVDTRDEHENGVEELEGHCSLLEVVGVDAGKDGHEQRENVGLALGELGCLPDNLSSDACQTSHDRSESMRFTHAVDRREQTRRSTR